MKVTPQTIPGPVHPLNCRALDWGWQGLIAYGCHSTVAVLDPRSMQSIQTLVHHNSNIIKVSWSLECYHHTSSFPYSLRLASVDSALHCVVWDVVQGSILSTFDLGGGKGGGNSLVDLQWLNTSDACRDLIAVMVNPSSMTILNAESGTRVSRFTFTETILAFAFDPFNPENLVLQSPECFIFVNNFNPGRTPTQGGKKLYMTAITGGSGSQRILSGDTKPRDTLALTDCLQIAFSPAVIHHLFLMYSREIVVLDTEVRQVMGSIQLDRTTSPFLRVMPCRQRDILYCLHENGCVSIRVRQPAPFVELLTNNFALGYKKNWEVQYDIHCHSEPLRISKTLQVFTGSVCPTSELRVAVFTSEGKILIWDVETTPIGIYGQELPEEQAGCPYVISALPSRNLSLVDVQEEEESACESTPLTLGDTVAPYWFLPPKTSPVPYTLLTFKMLLGGLWTVLLGTPSVIRMCPPLTTKNWSIYVPLLVVGTTSGSVGVVNLYTKSLHKELSVHTCTVRGIEWLNETSFVSYAQTQPNSSGQIRNEISITDVQKGQSTPLKRHESSHSKPIEMIRVSSHKNYLVINYKDSPLEFWDMKNFTFLRELVSNPPSFPLVEWVPSHGRSKNKSDKSDSVANSITVDFDVAMGTTGSKILQSLERETLTVMGKEGEMWQLIVEGSKVKVTRSTPTQTWLNGPTCLAWKGELMVGGDSHGSLVFIDNKDSQAKAMETPRSVVKKIRFAPGKGNAKLLILYATRVDIREVFKDGILSQMKWPSAGGKNGDPLAIDDAEWATSDKPAFVMSDGSLRIYNLKLTQCHAIICCSDFEKPFFSPHCVSAQSSLRLKSMLQQQPWNVDYTFETDELDESVVVEKSVKQQMMAVPLEFKKALIEAPLGTPQRCLLTAILFGDELETRFWSLALYYLLREKNRRSDYRYNLFRQASPRNPSSDFLCPDSSASISINSKASSSLGPKGLVDTLLALDNLSLDSEGDDSVVSSPTATGEPTVSTEEVVALLEEARVKTLMLVPPLDFCFDHLVDPQAFHQMQLSRALLHDCRRLTTEQTRCCAERMLLLGQADRAVQLLLEAEPSSAHYFTDALKACLTATIRSSGASQSTIKLVATNLIANSMLMEGVQLLCLIDKSQDACRYMQTYEEWHKSLWLAKSTLHERDCYEVFSRWAEHLCSPGVNQKNRALEVMLSLGDFRRTVEMLHNTRHFDLAAVFLESCLEYGVLQRNKDTLSLIEAVSLDYAQHLQSIGLSRGTRHYFGKAGERGRQLLEQYLTSSPRSKT